jgi:hypothetical protein
MKRRANFCRYVPAINGSPAWMTIKEAEQHLKKDLEHIERMIGYCKDSPRDLAFWESKHPYIEYVEDK